MNDGRQYETEMYYDADEAGAAVERLHGLGYERDDIGIVMDDKTRERAMAAMTNAKSSEGIAAGATIGGVLGAIVAGVTATGSVTAIVGTGGAATPFVAGPLVAAMAGLGVGGAAGGIIGGLIGAGIAEERAHEYEKGLRDGGILVAVRPKGDESRDDVRRALGTPRHPGRLEYAGETPEASPAPRVTA